MISCRNGAVGRYQCLNALMVAKPLGCCVCFLTPYLSKKTTFEVLKHARSFLTCFLEKKGRFEQVSFIVGLLKA